MHRGPFIVGLAAAATAPRIVAAQTIVTPELAIDRLFAGADVQPEWFSQVFLADIPIAKIRSVRADVVATLGAYQTTVPNNNRYTVTFARGSIQADAKVDAAGAFTYLLLSRMQSSAAEGRIEALFTTSPVPADWFSDQFLAAVAIDRGRAIVAAMKEQYGTFVSATPEKNGSYDVEFAKGGLDALIFLGSDGKIEGLIFQPH